LAYQRTHIAVVTICKTVIHMKVEKLMSSLLGIVATSALPTNVVDSTHARTYSCDQRILSSRIRSEDAPDRTSEFLKIFLAAEIIAPIKTSMIKKLVSDPHIHQSLSRSGGRLSRPRTSRVA
jgi:hypothetical protein